VRLIGRGRRTTFCRQRAGVIVTAIESDAGITSAIALLTRLIAAYWPAFYQ